MKTREMKYSNYGFDDEEAKRLKEYCRKSTFSEHEILLSSAIAANPCIAPDLYYSLVRGVGFDNLSKIKFIPYSKVDFYCYRKKCLAIFRKFLLVDKNGNYKVKTEPLNLFELAEL